MPPELVTFVLVVVMPVAGAVAFAVGLFALLRRQS